MSNKGERGKLASDNPDHETRQPEISEAGGVAEVAQVDALDEQAVEKHLGEVVKKTGGLIFPSMPSGSDTFRARHSSRWRLRSSPCRSQTP